MIVINGGIVVADGKAKEIPADAKLLEAMGWRSHDECKVSEVSESDQFAVRFVRSGLFAVTKL